MQTCFDSWRRVRTASQSVRLSETLIECYTGKELSVEKQRLAGERSPGAFPSGHSSSFRFRKTMFRHILKQTGTVCILNRNHNMPRNTTAKAEPSRRSRRKAGLSPAVAIDIGVRLGANDRLSRLPLEILTMARTIRVLFGS